jgi:hypothetical protein
MCHAQALETARVAWRHTQQVPTRVSTRSVVSALHSSGVASHWSQSMRSLLMCSVVALSFTACLGDTDAPATSGSAQELTREDVLVTRLAHWRVSAVGGDRGTRWLEPDYPNTDAEQANWIGVTAPWGYGESYVNTIPYGPNAANKPLTVYAYEHFYLYEDPSDMRGLRLDVMYDDGFVAYLNGTEIARRSMPAGPVTFQTPALGHEATSGVFESIDVTAHIALLQPGNNRLQIEVHQADGASSDLVFAAGLNAQIQDAPPPPAEGHIPDNSEWSYWDAGGDLGTAWRQPGFDVSEWRRGRGPLGYGDGFIRTGVSYGASASNKHITTYFRRDMTVEVPEAITRITAGLMYDDGIVVYLNGTEVARRAMPAGTITAATRSTGHEAAANVYEPLDLTAFRHLLVTGTNTFAFEVHQQSASSSDLAFDARVSLWVGGTPPPASGGGSVARRSTWSYWDGGGDLGTAWRAPAFADGAWATGAGPLGYGESYIATTVGFGPNAANKYPTTYFRKRFDVDLTGGATVTGLRAELMYDDGAVIYLNGTEVSRLAMPAGTITATTRSTGHEANNAYQLVDLSAHTGLIVDGENVLAVEVHQLDAGSSDLVMDLALNVETTGGGGVTTPVFQPYAGNPLITPSDGEPFWRASSVGRPQVVRVGAQWVMFYVGSDGGGPHDLIGRAVSTDGIDWTLDDDPITDGQATAAVHDGTRYLVYYGVTFDFDDTGGIFIITSPDGITWTHSGAAIAYDSTAAVTYDADLDVFEMWSFGNRTDGVTYSTSTDGVAWANHGFVTGITLAAQPHVIKEDDIYKMWFNEPNGGIRFATSIDGLTWTPRGVSLATGGSASVVRDGATLRMWYSGNGGISTATSP